MNFIPVLPFLRIMVLMAAPQDLPFSKSLLMRVLFLYFITGMLVLLPSSADLFTAMVLMLLDLVMLVAFIQFCLYTRNASNRFLQTFLACLGIGVCFQLLALPLMLALNHGVDASQATEQANNALGGLFYLLLVSWQVTVVAHILRHAMDMVMTLSLVLSFSYLIMVIYLSNQLVSLLASI